MKGKGGRMALSSAQPQRTNASGFGSSSGGYAAVARGLRSQVRDRARWTISGLGVGGIWLAVMFVSIFAPVMVTGTDPWLTWVPIGSILAVVAGIVLTAVLRGFVKSTYLDAAAPVDTDAEAAPAGDSAAAALRKSEGLRDSGLIAEAEFQSKRQAVIDGL